MRETPPLAVLILDGAAERHACPARESPLARATTPNLDRLAREGRVLPVSIIEREADATTAAPLLAVLGFDPGKTETARASYLGALTNVTLAAEECFASADFLALFRDTVADVEPGPMRPAEVDTLLKVAGESVRRAGIRLIPIAGSHHVAVAPRASLDPGVAPPVRMIGKQLDHFEPTVEQHAFAHRLARQALDGHEINEVRRDLGGNGADTIWIWGPGGPARLEPAWDAPSSALGTDLMWRGLCTAAGLRLRSPNAKKPAQLVRALAAALKKDAVCYVHTGRAAGDALLRRLGARADGLSDIDRDLIGPIAEVVASVGGRLVILPTARDTATAEPLAGPIPALIWGRDVSGLSAHPFTEAGAAEAGAPLAPGHGLVAYVRHL